MKTILFALAYLCFAAFALGMVHSMDTDEVTDCAPPQNEYAKLVATLVRNEDGVLVLICTHHTTAGR